MPLSKNKRKKLLRKLILQIMKGKFDSSQVSIEDKYPESNTESNIIRQQYMSPLDRGGTYNYGFMEIKELGAGDPGSR